MLEADLSKLTERPLPSGRGCKVKISKLSCGYKNNADLNAALNVLAAGHAVLACEWKRISGRKQELLGKSDQVLACAVA